MPKHTLTSASLKDEMLSLLSLGNVSSAISLFTDNTEEVEKAIQEYDPLKHKVMERRDIFPKGGGEPIVREKLPRTRQRYINEVELFFLLGNPIEWELKSGDKNAYTLFEDYLREIRFNSTIRQCKRLAGAETECALVAIPYRSEGKLAFKHFVVAHSLGYKLRTLFDQYGRLISLAYGYELQEGEVVTSRWDIHTAETIYFARKAQNSDWEVDTYPNPAGKILGIYFKQPKAWDGAEERLAREEMLDSKVGDENNYFANPIAAATSDVVQSMLSGESVAKMIQLTGSNSRFEYINPPTSSETRRDEMVNLERSILFDTFTPDLSFDALKGWGAVSGAAIRNSMALGFIKRATRLELYEPLVDRYKNIILSILGILHPAEKEKFREMVIGFNFTEPFAIEEEKKPNIEELNPIG